VIKGYRDLSQLVLRNARGVDYEIGFYVRSEDILIVAIHGGGIEPLTSELAHAIAGEDYNLFEFRGIRASSNMKLHVSSLRFKEIRLRGLLDTTGTAISIHGFAGEGPIIGVGGGNQRLAKCIAEQLAESGFETQKARGRLAGRHPDNLVNRPRDRGVQLELSRGLRDAMVEGGAASPARGDPDRRTEVFTRFVEAVRLAVRRYLDERRVNLERAISDAARTTALIPPELKRLSPETQR